MFACSCITCYCENSRLIWDNSRETVYCVIRNKILDYSRSRYLKIAAKRGTERISCFIESNVKLKEPENGMILFYIGLTFSFKIIKN